MIHPASAYTASILAIPPSLSPQQQRETGETASPSSADRVEDRISLSQAGIDSSRAEKKTQAVSSASAKENEQSTLSAEELKQLSQLKSRDREVRSHEQAHLSVAGQYARGGASFTLEKGPDGNSYAVGGEVPIDVSAESDPETTIQKMRVIRRAALAPADPSSADRQIAANASAKELQARQEMAAELQDKMSNVLASSSETQNKNLADNSPSPAPDTTVSGLTRMAMIATYRKSAFAS